MIHDKIRSLDSWDIYITPKRKWFDLNLYEIIKHKDLLWIFVKRDITSLYKQTILGPLWFMIQPLISTIIFYLIFNKIARIPTDDIPPSLFYMSGIIAWNYFSSCLLNTSKTFLSNSSIFGKVYFPRIIVPLSTVISGLMKLVIQLLLFVGLCFYFIYAGNDHINPSMKTILIFPILIIQMALLGQGIGMIISSFTVKYRDLNYIVSFGTQLMMYLSPIIYPLSSVPEKYKLFILINPMTAIIEGFRQVLLGKGILDFYMFTYSFLFSLFIFFLGLLVFNKFEKNFIDTI